MGRLQKRIISIILLAALVMTSLSVKSADAAMTTKGSMTFEDVQALESMSNLRSSNHTLTIADGKAALVTTTQQGDAMFLYNNPATTQADGITAVDITTNASWRCGVMFRSTDSSNYSWVGFDNARKLRIRECINGAASDILRDITALPTTFRLEVQYTGDNLVVLANGAEIFQGTRPRAAATENQTVVSGMSGIMAWSLHNTTFDNLTVSADVPEIVVPAAPSGQGSITFNDTTSINNMLNLLSSSHTMGYSNGQAALHTTTQSGDALFLYDEPETVTANGITSVDMVTDSNWRAGVVIRATDADNYTWIGFDNASKLRIRERINGEASDILTNIPSISTTVNLQVKYWGDNITVLANGVQLYNGNRPRANASVNHEIVAGKSGVMGWSLHNVLFDNLTIAQYPPTVTAATIGETAGVINETNITFALPYGSDLSALTPVFTATPSEGITVLPAEAQDFTNGTVVAYTVSLARGGTKTYQVSAAWAPMEVYRNEFTESVSFTNIGDTTHEVSNTAGTVVIANSQGNDLFIDTASPSIVNGIASVDYTNHSEWRTGIMYRSVDSDNFSWAAIESQNSIRIRETIGGVGRDIMISNLTLPGNSFKLSVHYYEDSLLVKANDTVLYNGVRPFKYGNNPLNTAPIAGQAGVMGWSVKNTAFDNLEVMGFVPSIVSAAGAGATAAIEGKTIRYQVNQESALSSFTPVFTTFPSNAVVSPAGAQDFSNFDASANGIPYIVSVGDSSEAYTVFAAAAAQTTMHTIENDKLAVRFHRQFPAVYDYTYKGSTNRVMSGTDLTFGDTIKINGTSYSPNVVFAEMGTDSVKYDITLNNVNVGGITGKTVTFSCIYTLVNDTVEMRIENVTGDEVNKPFRIEIYSPIFVVRDNADNAAITTGGTGGNNSNGGTSAISSTSSMNKSSLSFVFASNNQAAAAVYTQDQFNRPYTAIIGSYNGQKAGLIYSDGYHYRLSNGVKPVKDVTGTTTEEIPYVIKMHVCADENQNGTINWQDAALWTRKQMPQLPATVREFYNGGSWVQTHAAFPGNGNNGSNAVNNYGGFTTVYSELSQLLEAQRQIYNMTDGIGKTSYEIVGWNGRGHDYGWPNINEVTFNPALGTEAEFREMQLAMKEYNGDLSFHTNQTDMCDNSESYLRNQTVNEFGNRLSSTGTIQYGAGVFGWNAYKNSHFVDLPYALNRIDAFLGTQENVGRTGRFYAPKFMYSDVMLDYPKSGITNTDEQYAKYRLVDHYETLGTNLATEYYYSEKRTGGLYLMKNYSYPNDVDQFMNAGQTIFNDMRNVAVQAKDYIWATVYSDVARDGNASIAGAGNGNKLSTQHAELTFLLSYVNGFVGKNTLQSYTTNGSIVATNWSNGVVYQANTSNGNINVTENGLAIANLKLSGGRISGDSFIPAYDGTSRIFSFSTNGGSKTWTLPAYITASSFKLYRLTEAGRVFVGNVLAVNNTVTLNMDRSCAYVLDYTDGASDTQVNENVILTADVTASSNTNRALWSTYITSAPVPSEDVYVTKPDGTAWQADNDPLLKDLSTRMFMSGDATKLRYYRFVISGYSADGDVLSYWMPTTAASHWINYAFSGARTIASLELTHQSSVENLNVKFIATKVDGSTAVLYEGTAGRSFTHTLTTPVVNVKSIKVEITNAAGITVKLCEVGANTK